ncbi:MAG: thioredoxin domain-containing protein [Chloroflexota bacterium]|nr:thioredoxin domain-containing protein [Chloroflexota bacterium]
MTNRLINESSPYLLQHAHNPVDWYPWGDEAISRAKREDKPILISIGYSACHWCHVMERECFENQEIASLMNDLFICIKVDREERPDIDQIYMEAVQAMTGGGGWPLTAIITPEGKPFYGGTYFPPTDRQGLPGFPKVLKAAAEAYHDRRNDVEQVALQIQGVLSAGHEIDTGRISLSGDIFDQVYSVLRRRFDSSNGGFGCAPKFPQPMILEFLLRYYHRTKDQTALDMVRKTLEKMAHGGIYDHVGGGFHRYATDDSWMVPHFEKMLYDNALLARLYLDAYLITGDERYRRITEETLDYVLREMTSTEGGFFSSQDADSDGVEGKYYVWSSEEITETVGENHEELVKAYFGVTSRGNFEGKNILHVAQNGQEIALDVMAQARGLLLKKRQERGSIGCDDKILTSWNGLMLSTLAEAAVSLNRQDYLHAAVSNGEFLLCKMMVDGELKHTYKNGMAKIDGFLEDYASIIGGLLSLHKATFDGKWLRQAIVFGDLIIERFWNEVDGLLYDTSNNSQPLFVRPKNSFDGAIPSGASMAVLALLKLGAMTHNKRFIDIATHQLRVMYQSMLQHPLGFGNWLCTLDFHLSDPTEIALIGSKSEPMSLELLRTISATWIPNKIMVTYDPEDPNGLSELMLLQDRPMIDHRPTLYICHGHTCKSAVTDVGDLIAELRT